MQITAHNADQGLSPGAGAGIGAVGGETAPGTGVPRGRSDSELSFQVGALGF